MTIKYKDLITEKLDTKALTSKLKELQKYVQQEMEYTDDSTPAYKKLDKIDGSFGDLIKMTSSIK